MPPKTSKKGCWI